MQSNFPMRQSFIDRYNGPLLFEYYMFPIPYKGIPYITKIFVAILNCVVCRFDFEKFMISKFDF